jgi:hypothetical protein
MAYIGYNPSQLAVAPFAVKSFTGDGSTTTFTLDQSVPGANEANVEVFVENVQQSPIDAYTIGGGLNNSLIFSEAPASGAAIYVIHKGESTYNLQPSTGSVTAATLDPVLRNFTVDNFTGNGSTTTYTLTDTPYSANSILVTVDGIVQTASTNYTVSGTTLSFGSSAPDSGAVITVVHMGFSSGNKAVMDGSITPVKLSTGGPAWTTGGILAVGTTSPTSSSGTKLDVFSSTATISTAIRSTFSTGSAQLLLAGNNTTIGSGEFLISHDGSATAYLYNRSNTPMIFGTNNTERMRITSDGNVGLGTSSPSSQLEIKSAQFTDSVITLENTSANTTSRVLFKAAGTEYGRISGDSTQVVLQSGNLPIIFRTNSAERMRLDAAGLLTLPYGQIKFPAAQNASADANTLDDYEEGTWTPSIGGTATYSPATGTYTKIGKLVTFQMTLYVATRGTGSQGTISGLPFVNTGSSGNMCASYMGYFGDLNVSVAYLAGYIAPNSSSIIMVGTTAAAISIGPLNVIKNTTYLEMSGFYYTS